MRPLQINILSWTIKCIDTKSSHQKLSTFWCEKYIFVGVISLFLSNCAVGPNYKRPVTPLPKMYIAKSLSPKTVASKTKLGASQSFVANKDIPAQWWQLFHSRSLNDLIIASMRTNPSIEAAQEALRTALETAYAQQGALFPFLGISFSPTTQKTANILTSVLANNQYQYSLFTGQLFVSYIPDVFGGTRRQLESLMAQAESQRFQLEATYLALTANVVNAAIQEAALREQIIATRQIIMNQKKLLAMLQQQLKLGDAALSDVTAQRAALAASTATLPPLEKQLAIQGDLLNALTGRFPDDPQTPIFRLNSLKLPTQLPIAVPSQLIEHRPDIRAAEEQMHAANALIGVSIANRLPNFTINSTNLGTAATTLGTLLQPDTQFWALAGIIAQPIFYGGSLRHKQRAAEATYRQAAAQYRATVINAFQNVADTLKAIQLDAFALRAASNAEQAALTSLTIARRQLVLGDSNVAALLINQQAYHQAHLNLIQAQANRLTDTVALFQALGGGWENAGELKEY
ncbi:efflux transporter outer membrane subunit [Legionella sp.]|uniref:efflux transporter outer membrane subunit n=1 Tax=Legionella sp. TaxID=459 RepID=UPI003CAD426E